MPLSKARNALSICACAKWPASSSNIFDNMRENLSRDEIAKVVWGFRMDLRSRCIDQTVAELRRHLPRSERIETVFGIGYRYFKQQGSACVE